MSSKTADKDKSKVHKLSLKGSAKLVAEFVRVVLLLGYSVPPVLSDVTRLVDWEMLDIVANKTMHSAVSILHPHHPVREYLPRLCFRTWHGIPEYPIANPKLDSNEESTQLKTSQRQSNPSTHPFPQISAPIVSMSIIIAIANCKHEIRD